MNFNIKIFQIHVLFIINSRNSILKIDFTQIRFYEFNLFFLLFIYFTFNKIIFSLLIKTIFIYF